METLFAVLLATGVGFLLLRKKKEEHPALALPSGHPHDGVIFGVPDYVSRSSFGEPGDPSLQGNYTLSKGACEKPAGPCAPHNPHPNPEVDPMLGPESGHPIRNGIASSGLHQWCVDVLDKDTAGRIAEEAVGDRRRYVELLSANPLKPQIMSPEPNFADLCVGERLYLPRSWNPWLDQAGKAAGKKGPYPPYDKLPMYPVSPLNAVSMGSVPWPPDAPTGWMPIETIMKSMESGWSASVDLSKGA